MAPRTRLLRAELLALGFVLAGPGRTISAFPAPTADPQAIQSLERVPSRVPFPQSLWLLDVLEGTRRAEPRPRRTHYPELWNGRPAFDPESSAALLELVLSASRQELRLLQEMRVLALDRLDLGLPTGPNRRHIPRDLVAEFRRLLQEFDRLIVATRFEGYELLTGTTPIVFLFQAPPSEAPQRFFLNEDLSASALGLSGLDIARASDALGALDLLDTAIVVVTAARTGFLLAQQDFEEGPPAGGLIAVERILGRLRDIALLASDAHRDGYERALLDAHFQNDLSRLDALSARAHFEDIPLLRGGVVLLQASGSPGTALILELPDTGVVALDLSLDVTDVDNALDALQLLDAARSYVSQQRAALEPARAQLRRGFPYPR